MQGLEKLHPIIPKNPVPQYKPIERKKRKGKHKRQEGSEQLVPIKSIGPSVKTRQSHTIKYRLVRSFHRDTFTNIIIENGRQWLERFTPH